MDSSVVDFIDFLAFVPMKYCHREVILTHFGDSSTDNVGTRDNKLVPRDVASGHYGKGKHLKKRDPWVLPFGAPVKIYPKNGNRQILWVFLQFGAPVKIYPKNGSPFSGRVADVGAYDKVHPDKVKREDWIDVWNPEKSKKQTAEKGCIEIEIQECKKCPNTCIESKCYESK